MHRRNNNNNNNNAMLFFLRILLLLLSAYLIFHQVDSFVIVTTVIRRRNNSNKNVLQQSLQQQQHYYPSNSAVSTSCPRLTQEQLNYLHENDFLIIPNFLSSSLVEGLRNDIRTLRTNNKFNLARIGTSTTTSNNNGLNQSIRVAENCFLGRKKLLDQPNNVIRQELYNILDTIRNDISYNLNIQLDNEMSELLYVYYPRGGFYKRHVDAAPNSSSMLRKYSLLIYLNDIKWDMKYDGGALRIFDDEKKRYLDINPAGGTLVLFRSSTVPHEVCNTEKERMTIVGWYNRPPKLADVVGLMTIGC